MSPGMERRSLSRALSAALEYRERFKSSRWSWIASAIRANLSSGVVVLSVLVSTFESNAEPPQSVDRGGSTQKVGTRAGLTALQPGGYSRAITNTARSSTALHDASKEHAMNATDTTADRKAVKAARKAERKAAKAL